MDRARTRTFSPAKHPSTSDAMCLKTPRLRRSDCSVGRSTSMSSFTRVATGPRLPHPARSSRESATPLVLAILAMFCAPEPVRWEIRGRWTVASARLPGRPSARRATRARTLTSRSPFERPNAGGTHARPRARHPHPKDSLPHQPRKISPLNGGRLSAPLPRAPAARCPSFTRRSAWGSRVLSGEVTQRPTDAVSDRRLHDTLATSSGIAVLIVFEARDLQPIFLESIFDDFVIHHTAHSASFTSITLIWSYIPVRSFPAPRLFPIHRC